MRKRTKHLLVFGGMLLVSMPFFLSRFAATQSRITAPPGWEIQTRDQTAKLAQLSMAFEQQFAVTLVAYLMKQGDPSHTAHILVFQKNVIVEGGVKNSHQVAETLAHAFAMQLGLPPQSRIDVRTAGDRKGDYVLLPASVQKGMQAKIGLLVPHSANKVFLFLLVAPEGDTSSGNSLAFVIQNTDVD